METEIEAMCPTATLTNSTACHRKKMIMLTLCLALITLLIGTAVVRRRFSPSSSNAAAGDNLNSNTTSSAAAMPPSPAGNGHEDSTLVIKKACASTLHPSLCFAAISDVPAAKHAATFRDVLEIGINQSLALVSSSKSNIGDLMAAAKGQALNSQVMIALNDCLEMLDQSIYELRETLAGLDRAFPRPPTTIGHLRLLLDHGGASSSQSNIKTLLSAAMTNENTCLAGLSDLGGRDPNRNRNEGNNRGLEEYVENMLTPITRMTSDCLAFVRFAGSQGNIEDGDAAQMLMITNMTAEDQPEWEGDGMFPAWMTAADRNLMERESSSEMIADVVVARNGSGDYRSIGEAVRMAPSTSPRRFVIRVKPGVYSENVEISRDKVNIMLIGSGASHTVITGSRNFADGYSTFTSATLTVVGDKFLARELSIVNMAGPWKHQAVAARVTSNAAFYRCKFASHQDTLYAHSLRQFYRECTIQGTIDFIFGNAAAIFQNCTILVRRPIPGQENVITAQGREDPNQNTGISLDNCSIVAAPELKWARRRGQKVDTYLGRPWRNYSRTMVMKSYLGELIHPKGWSPWNEYTNLNTMQYIEFMNIGPGSKTAGRVRWPGYRSNCSEKMAEQFTVEAFFRDGSADQWLQSTGFPLFPSP